MSEETNRLATAMVEIERRFVAERPAGVVVRGDDDEALATALVAAKLLIPIEVIPGEPAGVAPAQAVNRHLIALLAQ